MTPKEEQFAQAKAEILGWLNAAQECANRDKFYEVLNRIEMARIATERVILVAPDPMTEAQVFDAGCRNFKNHTMTGL